MLKHRIKKIEKRFQDRERSIRIWNVKKENAEEKISEIIAGKVEHHDGGYYSEKDVNYFLDFDLFFPQGQEEQNAKKSNKKD